MKTQTAPKLATSRTGVINGKGAVTKDQYPAMVANNEAILNAGAAAAFKKVTGMTIDQFNEIYAPKGAETKVVDGVVHAAKGYFDDPLNPEPVKLPVSPVVSAGMQPNPENTFNVAPTLNANAQAIAKPETVAKPQNGGFLDGLANNVIAPIANGSVGFMKGVGKIPSVASDIISNHPVISLLNSSSKIATTGIDEKNTLANNLGQLTKNVLPVVGNVMTPSEKTQDAISSVRDVVGTGINEFSSGIDGKTSTEAQTKPQPQPSTQAVNPAAAQSNAVTENIATNTKPTQTSVAPSLLPMAKVGGKGLPTGRAIVTYNKDGTPSYSGDIYKQVQKNGVVSYSDRPRTTADAPVPLLGANNSTTQSRFAAQDTGNTSMAWTSPEAMRNQSALPVTPTATVPSISARVSLNGDTPNRTVIVGEGSAVPSVQPQAQQPQAAIAQPQAVAPQAVAVPVAQQTAEQQRVNSDPNATASQKYHADRNAATQAQAETQAEAPPSVSNGKLVQPAPTLLTPPPAQPRQRGFVAPQIQGILSAENQEALNDRVSRDILTLNRGTGNFSDALATKYAGKELDTILGKDTQTIAAGQANNNQAQDESQYQRTAKQKEAQDAWAQIIGVDTANYGKLKDQRAAQAATNEATQKQRNWEAENADKNLVYTAGTSKLNPDTGAYETTPAQVFNKKTGQFIPDLNAHISTQKANYDKAMSIVNDPNAKPEVKAQYQQWLSQFNKQG